MQAHLIPRPMHHSTTASIPTFPMCDAESRAIGNPKKPESQSASWQPSPLHGSASYLTDIMTFMFSDHISGSIEQAKMHSCEIFADHAKSKQLRARENNDDGCEKREAWDGDALREISAEHEEKEGASEHRQDKTEQACKL